MKILSLVLVLITFCLSCKDNEEKKQKHEDKNRSSPSQEVMPEKGRR